MSAQLAIDIFRRHGVNITPTRIYLLGLLLNDGRKLITLQDISRLSGGAVDRITVYRTLILFCKKGFLYKIVDKANKTYYALDAGLLDPAKNCNEHLHFRCQGCGAVTCLPIPVFGYLLPKGFIQTDANILLFGYCPACSPPHTHTQNTGTHHEK